jgi:hypothetical protein
VPNDIVEGTEKGVNAIGDFFKNGFNGEKEKAKEEG